MLDHQSRSDAAGFQQNGEMGKMLHGMLGWDKLIPESMAMYQAGRPTFRFASKPASEAHLWMLDGIAGGLQPWWHHVGAYHEDRRMYHTAEPVYQWHKTAEEFLINRLPLAKVGLVWSQANTDFYGRDSADLMVEAPWRGFTHALARARIPYLPVHADDVERDSSQFSVLVLPNLAAMSDAQAAAVKNFVARGGNLIATGHTSLFNELGDPRQDFALAELFGAHVVLPWGEYKEATRRQAATETQHTYLRLLPELRAHTDGPHIASEPKITSARHPVLQGFEETDLLPFGGTLEPLTLMPGAQVLATFVPPFPVYPPEKSWMRQPSTTIPGLIINSAPGGSRVVFLPADVDRRLAQDYLPDHANLLASAVRWAAGPESLLYVKGPGLLDCHLYHQPGRIILHIVNLTNSAERRQPVDELIPVGPFEVRIQIPADVSGKTLRLLVSGTKAHVSRAKRQVLFTIPSILEHEVAVVS